MGGRLMPFMEERSFTNYLPACAINNCLMQKYNLPTNLDYRTFCTTNGMRVMADLEQGRVCRSPYQ